MGSSLSSDVKLTVIIPCYNERNTIEGIIEAVRFYYGYKIYEVGLHQRFRLAA